MRAHSASFDLEPIEPGPDLRDHWLKLGIGVRPEHIADAPKRSTLQGATVVRLGVCTLTAMAVVSVFLVRISKSRVS